jgi:hypothetical protein
MWACRACVAANELLIYPRSVVVAASRRADLRRYGDALQQAGIAGNRWPACWPADTQMADPALHEAALGWVSCVFQRVGRSRAGRAIGQADHRWR